MARNSGQRSAVSDQRTDGTETERCELCRFALPEPDALQGRRVVCRRFPQRQGKLADDWCGEYAKKTF